MSGDFAWDSAVLTQTLSWGPTVRGIRWGHGAHRVLFLHEPGSDLDAWGMMPRILAHALKVETRAYDLPGHGLSDEPWNSEQIQELLSELLASEDSSARAPVVIAAGSSALAALQIADRLALSGLVALSPDGEFKSVPRSQRVPKLFFAGSRAGDDLDETRRLASTSGGWAVVTAVPVDARGTSLLDTDWNRRLSEAVAAFARDCLSASSIGMGLGEERGWG